jgi:hypothetical protein
VDDVIIQAPTTHSATNTATVVVVHSDEDGDEGRLASIFAPLPNAISPTLACTGSPALHAAPYINSIDQATRWSELWGFGCTSAHLGETTHRQNSKHPLEFTATTGSKEGNTGSA